MKRNKYNFLTDPDVRKLREAAELSFNYCATDQNGNGSPFQKAERSALAYERVIDYDNWQTQSEIYMPYALAAVEQALARALQQVFTDDEFFELIPRGGLPYRNARDVRDYMLWVLREKMKIWTNGYKCFKDSFKMGCGYGEIETRYITPWRFSNILIREPRLTVRELVEDYEPEMTVGFKYLNFAQVMPSPGGGENPDDRDWLTVIRYYDEEELAFMFADSDSDVDGDLDKIRRDAIDNRLDGYSSNAVRLMSSLTSESNNRRNNRNSQQAEFYNLPIKIPVVKYIGRDEEIWAANGTDKIFKLDSGPQLLHKNIVKASCRMEGDEWFCDGIIGANEDVFDATNVMYNVIMDMIDFNLRPRMITDSRLGEINMEPWGRTRFNGPMDQPPIHQVQVGQMQDEAAYMMQRLDHARQLGNHQADAMQGAPQSGIMRGGSGAVESLLQNTNAVEQVTGKLLDLTWTEDVIVKTLFVLQTGLDRNEVDYEVPQYDEEGRREYNIKTLTREDLQNDFRVEIMESEKYRNSVTDYQKRLNIANAGIRQDPMLARQVNPIRLLEYIVGDRKVAQKLMAGNDPEQYDRAVAIVGAMKNMADQTVNTETGGGASGGGAPSRGMVGAGGEGDQRQQQQAAGVNA